MCPACHVASTEEIDVLQTHKNDDGYTASIRGGSNGSNLEIYVQGHKSIRENKQPNVTVCLTCPTSVTTILVALRKHGSLSRNIQEELEAVLLFQ